MFEADYAPVGGLHVSQKARAQGVCGDKPCQNHEKGPLAAALVGKLKVHHIMRLGALWW
jgi:hypothetical protein